mmetsp:Transcript_30212/g.88352  ORF Transcript_30212/g.88352 Transcript_30212/m.88352 type:complete len:299 (-) Transcript_30212:377-1273(-)|eukprot:CAMPEP_0197719864 /NCGR_PEP_ID=MMETSP1434-20131217/3437_1 /TAXON_ID=265543 /ORGANISM="Minutocellus polymorphus, Strain CCMP3303" /LENGTH=298 /DNA_ID=CAMNT_0043304649 /DNA_START=45 /DNA_END=941 /DNA_ORIENTATION=+
MPPSNNAKRSRDGADDDGAKRVKVRSPSSSFVDHQPPINQPLALEYLCPITRELPVDPVMAEDGRIYERSAIEKYFITCQSSSLDSSSGNDHQGEDSNVDAPPPRQITSPMSGRKMGTNFYDAVQARNTIHFLISSKTISSELIENWKRNKDVHDANKGASMGDTSAMIDLASWYYYGCRGLSKNMAKSMEWYKKAANLDNTTAMVALSKHFLLVKEGEHFNQASGIYYLTEAANKGDASAALMLGTSFLRGENGVSKDFMPARKWLKHAEGASIDNDAPSGVAMLAKFLLARLSNAC